jgi:hypothetical protein
MNFKIKCNPGSTDAEVEIVRKIDIKLSEKSYLCEVPGCYNIATDKHCRFPETRTNIKLYKNLVFSDFNIMYTCNACNGSHAHIPKNDIWDENKFCKEAGIEPRSKIAKQKARFKK